MCEIKLLLFDTHHKSKDSKVFYLKNIHILMIIVIFNIK